MATTEAACKGTNNSDSVEVQLRFRIPANGALIGGSLTVPAGQLTVAEIMPALQSLTDAIVSSAEDDSAEQGKRISCNKGCGACCRQLVPISKDEAVYLRNLIADMPEDRRRIILDRFRAAFERLKSENYLDLLLQPQKAHDHELRNLGLVYLSFGIPCPFLENECCSIHENRPLSCREYLVTSHPRYCARPDEDHVRTVPIPIKLSKVINRIGAQPEGRFVRWQPLITLVCETDTSQNEPIVMPGPELLKMVLETMTSAPHSII